MADENNRMTDGVANADATGAQGAELGDEVLGEVAGGGVYDNLASAPSKGLARLTCPACGWQSEEKAYSENLLKKENLFMLQHLFDKDANGHMSLGLPHRVVFTFRELGSRR